MCSTLYIHLMTTTYAAHIVTADAEGLGDPEVIVMTQDEGSGAEALIAYRLTEHVDAAAVLRDNGWTITSEPANTDHDGYTVVDVQPRDWIQIIRAAAYNRATAAAELERQDTGWRTLVRDAMNDPGATKTDVADAAGVSRERAYQIRDGRR
jgi:hypothetical protein